MARPRISIVTPSLNQAQFLPWTIQSILGQNYPDLEYLIVDGGSADQSPQIIRQYETQLAWWCSEKDAGQTQAINKGFRHCTGEIVGWVNSDDILLPHCLEHVAHAFADPQVMVICGWGLMLAPDGTVRRRDVFPQPTRKVLLRSNPLMQPAVFWRRSLFAKLGYLDESYTFCMDREFWVRLAQQDIIPKLIPRFLAAYRKHPGTKTNTVSQVGASENLRLLTRGTGQSIRDETGLPALWTLQAMVLRLFLEKLTMFIPPYPRYCKVQGPSRI